MRYELQSFESDKHRKVIRERRIMFEVDPEIHIVESEYHDYEKGTHAKEQVSSKSALVKQLRAWLFRKDVSPVQIGVWKMSPVQFSNTDVEAIQRQFILEEL